MDEGIKISQLGEIPQSEMNPTLQYFLNLHLASSALTNGHTPEQLFDQLIANGWDGTLEQVQKWMNK